MFTYSKLSSKLIMLFRFNNECGEEAHVVLRLAFVDALGFSHKLAAEGKPR
jgi:hypothetical protein